MFRSIVLLEGAPSAQSEVLNALDWAFIKDISIFWCIELFFYSDESLSPCHWKTAPQHEAATSTLYFWDGTLHVMSSACFPSNMLGIEIHQTRESRFSQSEGVFSCVFTQERIASGHHKAQIGGVLQWCLSFCWFLLSPHMIMEFKSDHQVVGHHSNQSPSPSIAQFGLEASSRKSPGCSKLLPLRVTETTCFCEPSMQHHFFLNSSPDVWFDAILSLSYTGSLFDLRAWSLLWYALSAVRPFIKMCVPFQIISIQLNLPQVNVTQSLVTPTSNMNAPELNFNCPR